MTRRNLFISFCLFALGILIPLSLKASGLLFNYSDSVPVGLYRQSADHPGSYAVFCLSLGVLKSAQHTGLELPSGSCPGGVAPILKPVVQASLQHPIVFQESGFSVDGKLLPNTAAKPRSLAGVPLSHFPFGTYRSGLWAISDFSRNSFDSRYFGPVDSGAIRFHAVPVWISSRRSN